VEDEEPEVRGRNEHAVPSITMHNVLLLDWALVCWWASLGLAVRGVGPAMVYFLHMDQTWRRAHRFYLIAAYRLGRITPILEKQGQVECEPEYYAHSECFSEVMRAADCRSMPSRHLKGTFGCF